MEDCQCTVTKDIPSTCPPGFRRITLANGQCSCHLFTKPQCPEGSSVNADCTCSSSRPSCPAGTTISDLKVLCTADREPACPRGADLVSYKGECACKHTARPVCRPGNSPSKDGCTCSLSFSKRPQCSKGCSLDAKSCSCETDCKCKYIIIHVLMRDEKEGRKKQARSNKQQGKATQHTQGSHFS